MCFALQVAKDPKEGIAMAQEAQRAGKAAVVLEQWVALSQHEAAEEKATAGHHQQVAATA